MTPQVELQFVTHRNHYLFSDYYLNHRAAERHEWQALDARPHLAALRQLWAQRQAALHNANEAQTEADWIRPVLDLLGHHYTTQVSLTTPQGVKTPDTILCPDAATRTAVQTLGRPAAEADLAAALAVADAKAWDRPLDRSLPGAGVKTLHQHPALQIDFYIRHAGLPWGVLTNGRLWQLFHKDSSKKLDVYYEVDLPALLEAGDAEAFKYFWLFFRRAAFIAGSAAPGAPAWLDLVLAESAAYQQGVSDGLKAQVYEALHSLAQGFLDFPGNKLAADPASLQALYDHSLLVLYRLLFILYAEDRELLPVRANTAYRESYSLHALKRRIAEEIDRGQPAVASMSGLWSDLRELWRVIDQGNGQLGVPAYNGGLFKPANHPWLEQQRVGDLHLRTAIDLLARTRDPKTGAREFVDYRDLEIRHLGSIYEGLLEYRVVVHADKVANFSESWQLSLVNDKGERKATGSYYTPDAIVQYIVEHTVGPALAEAAAPFLHADGSVRDAAGLERAVLSVNVLDPAMGSGHFLVAAADAMARFLVEKGVGAEAEQAGGGDGESQLAYWRRRVAQACIYGVDLNPLAVELAKLSLWLATVSKDKPLSFLDHHLRCGNSLIGARVADLPLQPAAPAAPKRKSARAQAAESAARQAGQTSMLDDSAFAGSMRTASRFMGDIEQLGSETLADVHESERIYVETVRKSTERARLLADLWTARHFGLEVAGDVWAGLAKYVLHGGFALPGWEELIAQGRQIAAERRFFHWELEFPEVFFDLHGQPRKEAAGFDAVIGNPPYVQSGQISPIKPYLAQAHAAVYDGTADLYVYFYHQGVRLLRGGSRMSYIVTNKWLRAGYGEALRGFFADAVHVEEIVDFGHAPIFPDADVFPCIVVLRKPDDDAAAKPQTRICVFPREELGKVGLDVFVRTCSYHVASDRFGRQAWSLERGDVNALMMKMRRVGVPLHEFTGASPLYGIKTGFNQAFLIDTAQRNALITKDPACAELVKPYLRGQDVKRWIPQWADLWMIVLKSSENVNWPWSSSGDEAEGVFASAYPSLYAHLKSHEQSLRKRQDQGRYWWELRSCTYYEVFERPKIVHTDIAWRPQFALASEPMYLVNTAYVWPTSDLYVLAAVNSPLLWSYMWRNATHGKDEALRLIYSFVHTLPIASPVDEIREKVTLATLRVLAISKEMVETNAIVLDWLRLEFNVETPGQTLAEFWTMDADGFVGEVKRRRPRAAARFSPAALYELRQSFQEYAPRIRGLKAESEQLERRLSDLVNEAYGLTPEEVALLWETAPPRMPTLSSKS